MLTIFDINIERLLSPAWKGFSLMSLAEAREDSHSGKAMQHPARYSSNQRENSTNSCGLSRWMVSSAISTELITDSIAEPGGIRQRDGYKAKRLAPSKPARSHRVVPVAGALIVFAIYWGAHHYGLVEAIQDASPHTPMTGSFPNFNKDN
jgi:hypothetical protein